MSHRQPVSQDASNLSVGEAFAAMTLFVHQFAGRAGDDLLTLMGDISLWNGTTTDPAAWDDWLDCVAQVKELALSGPQRWGDADQSPS